MVDEHGERTPLSYNDYLRVGDLIRLQDCLSDPAHHDELLFITIHQTYELWFKLILHEIDAAIGYISADRLPPAVRALLRVVEIEKILVQQIHVLETMTPAGFLGFRDELNPASGFQSMQFHEIEFASGLKDESVLHGFRHEGFAYKRLAARLAQPTLGDAFFQLLGRRGMDAPLDQEASGRPEREAAYGKRTHAVVEVLTHFESAYEEFQLAEGLIAHDEYFQLWRVHHVRMVERMVGTKFGTGGTEGVGYLQTTLNKKFFPELWEARTHLGPKHTGGGCPFISR